jgi:Zn-finger nucleic acid-binding protein
MTDRQGVEIDYCPQCRGVWLDRGELDKLIERAAAPGQSRTSVDRSRPDLMSSDDDRDDRDGRVRRGGNSRSWLGDIFD